jgi:UDP-glucuronate decarboxylase
MQIIKQIIGHDIHNICEQLEEFEEQIHGHTFLVTGGAGFLGSWACDTLVAMGGEVVCVDNAVSGSLKNIKHLIGHKNFLFVNRDVKEFTYDGGIDYIIHMASIASPQLYQERPIETLDTNIEGTKRMLELAKAKKVKSLLFTSTSEVYGNAEVLPTPEAYTGLVNSFGPRACYDEGKRAAEAYCYTYWKKYGVRVRTARIFNTYGPRLDSAGYGRVVAKFVENAINGAPLTVYGDGGQTRSFCYVADQIVGLIKLLLIPGLDGTVVNIGGDEETAISNLAALVVRLAKSDSGIITGAKPLYDLQDDPRRRKADIRRAKQLLDWSPKTSLEDGLGRTIKYIKICNTATAVKGTPTHE